MEVVRFLGAGAAAVILALSIPARAEFKVLSPVVDKGEAEVEAVGSWSHDRNPGRNGEQSHVLDLEYGVTDVWMTELEGEWARDPGTSGAVTFRAANWGNLIAPFAQGELWADVGLWAEYGKATRNLDADAVKIGPLVQKSLGPTTATGNFFLERQVGPHAGGGTDLSYAVQVRYDWRKELAPAIEAYGDLGDSDALPGFQSQQHRIGPVLTGGVGLGPAGEFKWELGYLAGYTPATPQHTVKWRLEYELAL